MIIIVLFSSQLDYVLKKIDCTIIVVISGTVLGWSHQTFSRIIFEQKRYSKRYQVSLLWANLSVPWPFAASVDSLNGLNILFELRLMHALWHSKSRTQHSGVRKSVCFRYCALPQLANCFISLCNSKLDWPSVFVRENWQWWRLTGFTIRKLTWNFDRDVLLNANDAELRVLRRPD